TFGTTSIDTPLGTPLLGSPHRFRIDWMPGSIVYSVDGAVVATHAVTITTPMRPLVADLLPGGSSIDVDWLRLTPYATSGSFTSRVFDATRSVHWGSMSWTATTPAGAALAFFVRYGDTPTPDGTWTAFAPVAGNGASISGSARYAQYLVNLSTSNPSTTAVVSDVTLTHSFTPPNAPPIAHGQATTIVENTAVTLTLTASHVQAKPPTFAPVGGPAHGTLMGSAPTVTYQPAPNFTGTDSFTFKATDGELDSNVATVTITVTPVTEPPIAHDQATTIPENTTATLTLTATHLQATPLAFAVVRGPAHGTLTGAAPSVTYEPAPNFTGTDSFTFKATDGELDSNVATVTITVTPVTEPPIAHDQARSVERR